MFLLQLRNELWKLFGKKRTYIGFFMFLLAQNVILLIFRFTRAPAGMERILENNGIVINKGISILISRNSKLISNAFCLTTSPVIS